MRPKKEGAIDGIRTRDLSLTKRVLYQLSYDGGCMLTKEYICPGSNRRPSACKADVITNYTTDAPKYVSSAEKEGPTGI